MSFADFQFDPAILRALTEAGYTAPTPVQAEAIPEALAGRDVIASAQTGTGKTAAFMLPALQALTTPLTERRRTPRVLVLTPTRELAAQVTDAAKKYGRYLRVATASIVGGMPYAAQLRALSGPLDLVVGTPGRLLDHMERGRLDLSQVQLLVLDEADRMLDMGFKDDVEAISAALPQDRQTLLFTATLDATMQRLAERLLRDPVRVAIEVTAENQANIEQRLHVADDHAHKRRLLERVLSCSSVDKAIVFVATKRDVDALADALRERGLAAAPLHGDMPQSVRNRTLAHLRSGRVRLLVATDVAARGIDVSGISHVVNFDLPKFAEDYVHRIGRTGRAGASGIAIALATPEDIRHLERIERYTGQALPESVLEGLEPTRRLRRLPPRRPSSSGPRGKGYGPRRSGEGMRSSNNGFGRDARTGSGESHRAPRDGTPARRPSADGRPQRRREF
ncbi:superfamily II DNA/RNA helicase [Plasticicumulans lactativorans]|uniref:DEAD-box ATP-dependent RNA helicase RhpA n=1 Tax=Plasticicumulans lactativorans TaxID=1133106 RepID=A0A4R2LNH1_9GAMM|nr:DEAD/DEAH box helicase [Plasticicumulans lactativorans]TCO81005.1 superfamily II DNA/RNA helicase [Plasticicumulans lactativorans]